MTPASNGSRATVTPSHRRLSAVPQLGPRDPNEDDVPTKVDEKPTFAPPPRPKTSDVRELRAKPPIPPRRPVMVPPMPQPELVTQDIEVVRELLPPPPDAAPSVAPPAAVSEAVVGAPTAAAIAAPASAELTVHDWLGKARRLRAVTLAMTAGFFLGYVALGTLRWSGRLLVKGAVHIARLLEHLAAEWARASARAQPPR
jgi:hypothetical protein